MPLRVAEQDGYIHAVNRCEQCPFLKILPTSKEWRCGHKDESIKRSGVNIKRRCIPVWCPLPTGEYRELKVLEPENKLNIRLDHRHIERKE